MTRILLSLLFLTCFGMAARAATVSGTVTNASTCLPASGQVVYLRDSFFNYVDSAVTNSAGAYSITFPSSWATPKGYLVTIHACSNVWNSPGTYTGANATVNPIICGAAKNLSGTIMLGSSPNTGAARVYLIKVQRNFPTVGDTTLTAVDSVTLTNNPNFNFRRACAPSDTFLIKAMLLPGHPAYNSWLPSYDSSLSWSTATRYRSNSWNGMPHYLFLFAGTNPGGPGFIGGSVLAGANKQAGVGDPLPARLLMLTNASTGAPVAYTYSDAAGKFSFSNLAVGTYRVFGDSWGLHNLPLIVTISATSPSVNNIIFEEHYGKNTFEGRFNTTSVSMLSGPLAGVSIFPNPATAQVTVLGLDKVTGAKTVDVFNLLGAQVMRQHFGDAQPVQLRVADLAPGTYMLRLSTEQGSASFKLQK